MTSTSAFTFELIVLSALVLGFGTWMMQQAKALAPKRVLVRSTQSKLPRR